MDGQTHLAQTRRRIPGPEIIGAFVALAFVSSMAVSAEFIMLSVDESEGEYHLKVESVIDAPAHYVYNIITDYKHAYRINPSIVEARVLPTDRDAALRIMNHSVYRIGPFDFSIEWVGDVSEPAPGTVTIKTIPELSSFESGYAVWVIRPLGKRTRVNYDASLKPKFFIPPVIGDYIVKKRLHSETVATFTRIECHARLKLDMDMENDPNIQEILLKEKEACSSTDKYDASLKSEDQ